MLASNRSFLEKNFPDILSRIDGVSEPLTLEPARSGRLTCRYEGRFLHSPYDPLREAAESFGRLGHGLRGSLLMLGAGLGYGLTVLPAAVTTVVIVEKDPAVFEALCRVTDLASFKADLRLLVGPTERDFAAFVDGLADGLLAGLTVWELRSVFTGKDASFYRAAAAAIRTRLERLVSDITTAGYFAPVWFSNTLKNLGFLERSVDLASLRNLFTGHPAAVVAAGPTLDETVSRLSSVGGGTVVIAAATAVRRLLRGGITPHFVVSTDAGYYNSWHTRGLVLPESVLVSDPSVNYLVPRTFTSRRAFLDFGLGFLDPFADDRQPLPRFGMAGTVASTCVDLAGFLGCRQVWLFGQDFAFVDDRTHCRSTIHETYGLLSQTRTATLETSETASVFAEKPASVPDAAGRSVRSSMKLFLYREWFVKNYPGLRQASPRSARLADPASEEWPDSSGCPSVSERMSRTSSMISWKTDRIVAGLAEKAIAVLGASATPEEFLGSADRRLAKGMKCFLEFEMFRLARKPGADPFPPSLRALALDYLSRLRAALESSLRRGRSS